MQAYRRVLAYARVSSDRQGERGTSLDEQRERFAAYCAATGLPEPVVYPEIVSASYEKIEKRVALAKLLRDAQPGDLVLALYVDRWSRDLPYGVQTVRDLVRRGVGWRSVGENIDASTREGDSLLGVMAWAADQWLQRHRDRIASGKRRFRDAGCHVQGRPPLGYRRENRRLVIAEPDAEQVREAYRRCVAGESVRLISEALRRRAPERHRWNWSNVHVILRDRVYLGEIRRSDGERIAAHEPLIDLVTWSRAQAALSARSKLGRQSDTGGPLTSFWLLRGLAKCARCGRAMTASFGAKKPRGIRCVYYACNGSRVRPRTCEARGGCRVEATDAEVGALVRERLRALRSLLMQPPEPPLAPLGRDYAAERDRLAGRRSRLLDLVESGTAPPDIRERLDRIAAEVAAVDVAEAEELQARGREVTPAERAALLGHVDMAEMAWDAMTPVERRELVKLLAARVELERGQPPRVTWHTEAELLDWVK